jgi:hypothetical protein
VEGRTLLTISGSAVDSGKCVLHARCSFEPECNSGVSPAQRRRENTRGRSFAGMCSSVCVLICISHSLRRYGSKAWFCLPAWAVNTACVVLLFSSLKWIGKPCHATARYISKVQCQQLSTHHACWSASTESRLKHRQFCGVVFLLLSDGVNH